MSTPVPPMHANARRAALDTVLAGLALAGTGWCAVELRSPIWGDSPLPAMGVAFLGPTALVLGSAVLGLYGGFRWGAAAHWLAVRWAAAVGILAAAVLIAAW